jgi:hypothetical protein
LNLASTMDTSLGAIWLLVVCARKHFSRQTPVAWNRMHIGLGFLSLVSVRIGHPPRLGDGPVKRSL